MRSAMALVVISSAASAILACGENPVEQTDGPGLTLSADSLAIEVGTSASVTAAVLNTSQPAQFVSRDQSVASVNASGSINGVAVGSTYIVATLSGHPSVRDSVRVRVLGPPELVLSPDSVTVNVGATVSLSVTVRNTTESAQFISRDPGVATVSAGGGIGGVGIGSTYVVATLANRAEVRDSVRVRVQADTCALARPDFGGPANAADRALFAYDASAPLNLKTTVDSTRNGVEFNSISYDSPGGGSATGILYRPVGRAGLHPGIVVMHASGTPTGPVQGARIAQFEMLALAQRGAVVIGIDAPYVRRGGTNPPTLPPNPLDRPEQIQLMKDLQRAVDVLLARGDVDPARIAFTGYSYGGMVGVHFAGIEGRLKAAVITAGYGGNVTAATNTNLLQYLSTVSCATRNAWLRANAPIEGIRFISGASPTALLFQIARFDTAVLPADAQAAYDAASSPKEVLYYDTGHGLNAQAIADRYAWLHKQIGIDP